MKATIRLAIEQDMPRVLDLITELAIFEKEPTAVETTADYLVEKGFGPVPEFTCFVAEINGKVEGMALVHKRFSTWKGVSLHLEDLIVSQASRGLGLGTLLLDRVVQYAKELKVKRVSWEVLDWNTPAIEFYNKKGAKIKDEWRVVHLDEQGIQNYPNQL